MIIFFRPSSALHLPVPLRLCRVHNATFFVGRNPVVGILRQNL